MGFASPDEFDPPFGGLGPNHLGQHGPSKGSISGAPGFLGIDFDQDFEGQGFESDLGAELEIDQAGHVPGPVKSGVAPHKQFKEDEDDFFENQYMRRGEHKERPEDSEAGEKGERIKPLQHKRAQKFARQQSDIVGHQLSATQHTGGYHQRGQHSYGGGSQFQGSPSPNLLSQTMSNPNQQFSATYGHGLGMAPGTAPTPGQGGGQLFQYHPALQQT